MVQLRREKLSMPVIWAAAFSGLWQNARTMGTKLLDNIKFLGALWQEEVQMQHCHSAGQLAVLLGFLQLLVSRLNCSHAAPHLRMKFALKVNQETIIVRRLQCSYTTNACQCSSWRPTVNNNGYAWTRQGGTRSEVLLWGRLLVIGWLQLQQLVTVTPS